MTAPRHLGKPRAATVRAGADGLPMAVGTRAVEHILEDWLVEDRWWSGRPVRRRYLEVVLEDGRCALVFRDLVSGRWFSQRS